MQKNVAVLLAGCGNRDGAEINEAVMTVLALRLQGFKPAFFSLDHNQQDVVSHLGRNVGPGTSPRNIMEESARIARGEISDMKNLDPSQFQALALPGGFGVAKNFCSFATKGAAATVDPEVQRVLSTFLAARKPILAVCIAPALLGLVAKSRNLSLTLTTGSSQNDAARAMRELGHMVEGADAASIVVDSQNKIVSTPAFMLETSIDEIWKGIQAGAEKLSAFVVGK